MNCLNCGIEINGKYCSNCGQRTNVKRITFKEGWNDFWARAYGFDGMFPRTLRDLTIRPGEVARNYIEGNRALYYGPVGYFFLMITIFLLFLSIAEIDVIEFMSQKVVPVQKNAEKLTATILSFISENLKLIAFLLLPFNAIAAHFLLFRSSGYNFLEHMVLPFYVLGHLYWLNIISAIVYLITGSFFMNVFIAIFTFFYFGFAYSGFITYQSKTKAFLKGLAVPLVGQLIMSAALFAVIFLMAATIPEFYEFIRPSNNR